MEILIMQVFVSLLLVVGSVLLFIFTARQRDFEHADRLALLPLDSDDSDEESQGQ
ncbi:MAG: cytochrome oxidase [Labilithrix sp.]|nr:cytochrome oxidase [Labilithrix sp.]